MAQLRNSHVLVYHGPFLMVTFLLVENAIYFYYGVYMFIKKKRIYMH